MEDYSSTRSVKTRVITTTAALAHRSSLHACRSLRARRRSSQVRESTTGQNPDAWAGSSGFLARLSHWAANCLCRNCARSIRLFRLGAEHFRSVV